MGHELEEVNGRVEAFFAETGAWHGLGKVVNEAPTAAGALEAAGLGWTVEKRALWANGSLGQVPVVGEGISIPDTVATVRTDCGKVLGLVGAAYSVVQNHEVAGLMDEALAEAGLEGVRYESAGALRGGRNVWFLARLSEALQIGRQGDRVVPYALGLTSHDGSRGLTFFPTAVRVVCANTLRMAWMGAAASGVQVSFAHTGRLRDRLPSVVAAWRTVATGVTAFESAAQALASKPANPEVFGKVIADVVRGIIAGRDEESEKRRKAESAKILRHFAGDGTPGNGLDSSAWSAYQAVDYWLEHEARRFKSSESRFESVVYGEVAAMKGKAFAEMVAAA